MTTYLYCLHAPDATPPVGVVGIDGAVVRLLDAAGFGAWVSDSPARVEPTVGRLEAHDRVCAAALVGTATPLPIRFGQTFGDDEATAAAIEARKASLRARLDRVAGCVEMRLVFAHGRNNDVVAPAVATDTTESGSPETALGPGTVFLRRMARAGRDDLAREAACEEVRHAVRTRLRSLIVDARPCESARGVAFFATMVRRSDMAAFRSAVAELFASQALTAPPGFAILGPFAPYSFAGDA